MIDLAASSESIPVGEWSIRASGDLGARIGSFQRMGAAVLLDLGEVWAKLDDPFVQAHPDAFANRRAFGAGPIDPRQTLPAAGAARPRLRSGSNILLPWLEDALGALIAAGAQGFRIPSPAKASASFWAELGERLRRRAGPLFLIADTVGASRAEVTGLRGAGFDAVTSSAAWWDGRAAWLIEEYEALRSVAPVLADLTRLVGREPAQAAQILMRAAVTGAGLIAPVIEGLDAETTAALGLASQAAQFDGGMRRLTEAGAPATALLRTSVPDVRRADEALLVLVNPCADADIEVDPVSFLATAGMALGRFSRLDGGTEPFARLAGGEVRLLTAAQAPPVRQAEPFARAEAAAEAPRVAIEALSPSVDGGRFAVKRTVGDPVRVEADMFGDGHEQLAAELLWRPADEQAWRSVRMAPLGNDRWAASFVPERLGRHLFTVEAWMDVFGGYRRDLAKKLDSGVARPVDLQEGRALVQAAHDRAAGEATAPLAEALASLKGADDAEAAKLLLSKDLAVLMDRMDARPFRTRLDPPQPLDAERLGARFASWYELFPRSQTDDPSRHGTFDDVIARLPAVRDMGFDVLYFTPIHPIGRKNRKGRNNSLTAGPDDPGSPYAIGSEEGGHDAVHPELGGMEAFERLVAAAGDHGLEIALDFAVQCAPDHPWLTQHPGWFDYRPDGAIKYAENPPKKYEDIVNVDFYKPAAIPELWIALRDVVLLWVGKGVRLFRVDNPHTKPLPFWEWLIADVRGQYPDVVFLAEAFTRPKVMYRLAKIGFSQSYTYFTWRHTKAEFIDYMTELTTTAPKDFFRPHFFVNTPDINPYFLQTSGRAGFLIRAALAATLSGLFGVYSGFELLESDPVPGKEEYKDSEKYEIKPRDWTQSGNIIAEITKLNAIRKANPALQTHLGVTFYNAFNDSVLYYGKATAARSEMVLVAVSLDPHNAQAFDFEIPLWEWSLPDDGALEVEDLLTGARFTWWGKRQHATLAPDQPYAIWRVQPARIA